MYTLTFSNNLILGRYEVIETAGVGGSGTVLHAYDTHLKREVAIKAFKIGDNKFGNFDDDELDPGISEARAAAKLKSENIVTIYDCVESGDEVYIIEEFVEGITLTKLMKILGDDIDLDIVSHIFRSVTNALLVAHKENILHLDIKPDNIMIGRGGEVKVTDFGLATLMDLNGEGTASAGTLGQMPPEQLERKVLDVRTDEWAVGLVLYEMLTGKNPFKAAKNLKEQKALYKHADLLIPSACWDSLPEAADDVIFRALNASPDNRYPTLKNFVDEVKPYLGEGKDGKKKLAVIVNGNEDAYIDTTTKQISEKIPEPEEKTFTSKFKKFVRSEKKRLLVMRILSGLSAALVSAFSCVNFATVTNLEHILPVIVVGFIIFCVVVGSAILTYMFPRWLVFFDFVQPTVTLFLFQGWLPGTVLAVILMFWWGYIARLSDEVSFTALLCPLAGAIWLSPISIIMPALLHDKFFATKDIFATIGVCVACAFVFDSFGTGSILGWNPFLNFFLPTVTSAANEPNMVFLYSLIDPVNWIVVGVCGAFCIFWVVKAKLKTRRLGSDYDE